MKFPRVCRFPITIVFVLAGAAATASAQWTGLGTGGSATDASDPLNYTGGATSIGNFSGNNVTAILDLSAATSTGTGGLNLNFAANPISLTLGDSAGATNVLTLAGNINFTRAALAANNSSFITGTDVTLDLGTASRSITGTSVMTDAGSFNLTFNGAITSSGTGAQRLTVAAGSPTTIFNGNVTLDGGITFSSGTSTISVSSMLNVSGAGANALQSTGGTIANINGQLIGGAGDNVSVSGGILWLTNATNSYSGTHTVSSGILRGADGVGIKAGNILLSGGVFESTSATAFTRALGTGDNQVRLTAGNAGFSARDVAAVYNLGGAGATLQWGSTNFNPTTFTLGSGNANNTTELQNGIDLNGGSRQINVNSAGTITAGTISGVISDSANSVNSGFTFNSTNTGTAYLYLTADNTYVGRTVIANSSGASGTLMVSRDRNLGATPTGYVTDNIILAANGYLQALDSFTLDRNRGIGIGNSGGGAVTGGITVATGEVFTVYNTIANRTLAVTGTATPANTGSFVKNGAGVLNLYGENSTYSGRTTLSAGTLRVMKIANTGTASSIGSGSELYLGNGRLEYVGSGDTSNRTLAYSTSTVVDSSGSGALQFTNTGTIAGIGTASARTITLTGYNQGENSIAGAIADSGLTTNITGVTKYGSGNWSLSGTNTNTGAIRVYGGNLTFDYSGNGNTADPLSATSAVNISGAALTFQGKTSGTTAETVASLAFNALAMYGGLNKLVLDSNGGSGVALTVTSLAASSTVQSSTLIDLSSSAGNSITVNALASGAGAIGAIASTSSNGTYPAGAGDNILMANATRAQIIVRDATGYGFATLSTAAAAGATTTGATIGKLSSGIDLDAIGTAGTTTATDNVRLDASTTRSSALLFKTLTIDSTSAPITLSMGSNTVGVNNSGDIGRGILVYGANDVSLAGTGNLATTGANSIFIHHYGTGKLSIAQNIIAGTTEFAGTGLVEHSGAVANGNNLIIQGNVFRETGSSNLSANNTGVIALSSGGVFEIGNDLNGAGGGDFSNAVGTGTGQIRFQEDSGVSAYGADRTVNFGGASAGLTWGSSGFLVSNESTGADGDYTFKLSSAASNAKVTVENPINLANRNRTIEVANGSAATDATLSGNITGGTTNGVGITKTGAGTLSLTGAANDYTGSTRVTDGTLIVAGGGINSSTIVAVENASLALGAANVLNDSADITLQNASLLTNGNAEQTGKLELIGNNQLDLGSAVTAIRFADSSAVVWGATSLTIQNWTGLSSGGGDDQVIFGSNTNGLTSGQLAKISFLNPTVDGVAQTGSFAATILANGEIVALIPEPSAILLTALGSLAAFRRRRN